MSLADPRRSDDSLVLSSFGLRGARLGVGGFKHHAVLMIAAAVGLGRPVRLSQVPAIQDIEGLSYCLTALGGHCTRERGALQVDASTILAGVLPSSVSESIHGPIYLIPVIIGQVGRLRFTAPGGCQIGSAEQGGRRPIRQVLEVLERFGTQFIQEREEYVGLSRGLKAADLDIMEWSNSSSHLSGSLVSGATKTAILAALCCQSGVTVIRHPYLRPETIALLDALRLAGVAIDIDNDILRITPGQPSNDLVSWNVMPDLIEVITYVALAVAGRIPIEIGLWDVERVRVALHAELSLLSRIGVDWQISGSAMRIQPRDRLAPFAVTAGIGSIYSDCLPFFALMAIFCDGTSILRDTVWENRFSYVSGLQELGALLATFTHGLRVIGGQLHQMDREVCASDLRAVAVLSIAAAARRARTAIQGVSHLGRGYEDFFGKLRQCGVEVHVK